MEAVEAYNVLRTIRKAMASRDYHRVERVLEELPTEELLSDPELPLILASAKTRLFKHQEAKRWLAAAEEPIRTSGSAWLMRRWQTGFAVQLVYEGALEEAEALLNACIEGAEDAAHVRIVAYANNALGILSAHRGDTDTASLHFQRSIAIWQRLGNRRQVGFGYFNIAVLLREWGWPDRAAANLLLAEEHLGSTLTTEERVLHFSEKGLLMLATGDIQMALRLAERAVDGAQKAGNTFLKGWSMRVLGATLHVKGDLDAASYNLAEALAAVEATSNVLVQAEVHEELSLLALSLADAEAASLHKKRAIELFLSIKCNRHAQRFSERYRSYEMALHRG